MSAHSTTPVTEDRAVREVVVRPKSNLLEIGIVAYTVLVICVVAGYRVIERSALGGAQLAGAQQRDAELAPRARFYNRNALAALGDMEFYLTEDGRLPDAEQLARDGIPPFDLGLAPAENDGLRWVTEHHETWVDYVISRPTSSPGRVDGSPDVAYVVRVIDLHADYHPHPHPGIDYDPEQRLAMQLFEAPDARSRYPGERLLEAGWIWRNRPSDSSQRR